jgi:transmembrane sensor
MSALPKPPLRDVAPVRLDDMVAQRLWRGVVARRAGRRGSDSRRLALAWLAIGALAGALLTSGFYWTKLRLLRPEPPAANLLAFADGKPLVAMEASKDAPRRVALSDGSVILLSRGARVEALENAATSLSLLLSFGEVHFDVEPHGPRRWSIECGLATVEVVGTEFTLTRVPSKLVIHVSRGVVLVRGERVPDRVRRLEAGGALEILASEDPSTVAPAPSEATIAAPPDVSARAATGWRELSRRGEYAHAYDLLGRGGIGLESAGSRRIDDLMALADVARLSGHPADAVEPLTRVVNEFSTDPRASLAAFTLGKIHMAEPAGGERAAADFRAALRLGLPASLGEDAYANVVESLRRAGDDVGARAAALEFGRRFPTSPRSAALVEWASRR